MKKYSYFRLEITVNLVKKIDPDTDLKFYNTKSKLYFWKDMGKHIPRATETKLHFFREVIFRGMHFKFLFRYS